MLTLLCHQTILMLPMEQGPLRELVVLKEGVCGRTRKLDNHQLCPLLGRQARFGVHEEFQDLGMMIRVGSCNMNYISL